MAINLTDTASYIDAGDFSVIQNLEPITVCAWIYPTGWGGGTYGRIIDKGDSNVFFVTNAGGTNGVEALAWYRTRTGTATNYRSNDNSIVLNTWQHVAVSSTSLGSVLYINGQPVASYVASDVGSGSLNSDVGTNLYIANRADLARNFEGQQSDIRIYNQALDANAIYTIYSSFGHDNILDGLVLRYPCMDKPPGVSASNFKSVNSSTVTAATNVTVNVPTVNNGDVLLAFVACGGNSTTALTVSTPTGWTLINSIDAPSTFSTPSLYIFGRTANSEPASYNFVSSGSNSIVAAIAAYNGDYVTLSSPVSGTASGESANPTAPSVTATGQSIVIRAMIGDANQTVTYPSSTVGRFTGQETGTGNGCTFAFSDEPVLTSGATGTGVFTYGASDQWGAITVALRASSTLVSDVSINQLNGIPSIISYSEDRLSYRRRV
jgi:hypothetical protein